MQLWPDKAAPRERVRNRPPVPDAPHPQLRRQRPCLLGDRPSSKGSGPHATEEAPDNRTKHMNPNPEMQTTGAGWPSAQHSTFSKGRPVGILFFGNGMFPIAKDKGGSGGILRSR